MTLKPDEDGVVVVKDEWPDTSEGPTARQREFWAACAEKGVSEILFSGAIRGGKTQAAAKQIVAWAWRYGGTYMVLRKTYRELADSTQKAILFGDGNMPPALPRALQADYGGRGGYLAKHEKVVLRNGAEILFRSAEDAGQTIDKVKNVTLAGFLIDQVEELESDAYFELYKTLLGRLSHPKTPLKALLVANPSSESHWVYTRFVDPVRRKPYSRYVHCTIFDNKKNLPQGFLTTMEHRRHDDPIWYDRFALGKWGAFGGKRFKTWDQNVHMIDPVPVHQGMEIVEGVDFGWANPTAVVWCAIDYNGRWYVIADYELSEKPVSYHARQMHKIREELNVSPSSIWLDPSAFTARDQYESPAMEFMDYGILPARAQNDRLGGWNRIDEMLQAKMEDGLPQLLVFKNCKHVPRELSSARIKEGTDDIEKENDHALDALRYAISSRNPSPIHEEEEEDIDPREARTRRLLERVHQRQEQRLWLPG